MLWELLTLIKRAIWPQQRHDYNISSAGEIAIKIITPDNGVLFLEVKQNELVADLKKLILEAFGDSDANDDMLLLQMKLTRTKTGKRINDFDYLDRLQIKSEEELVLSYRRRERAVEESKLFLPGPGENEIYAKTSHQIAKVVRPIVNFDFLLRHDDLRKLFVTFAQECAYVIGLRSYSNKIIMFYQQRMRNYISKHENVFQLLCQLGFSPDNVRRALKLSANNYKFALDWLIDNVKYPEVTTDIRSPRVSILSSKFNPASFDIGERIDGLLEIVKFYAEKDEPIVIEHLTVLIYMGYDIDEAREALRRTNNNIGAACAYLAGEQSPSVMELREGLSHTSPIYRKLLESPKVQQLLSFPESFVYFITFLDKRAFDWDTFEHSNGELMAYIVDMYHDEKHALAVNQFNGSLIPISALSAPPPV